MKKLIAGIIIVVIGIAAVLFMKQRSKDMLLDGDGMVREISYQSISAEEAKKLMDNEKGYLILDVREEDEFNDGHIPGAMLLPLGDIEEKAAEQLTDQEQLILVYCRSGRRSKEAAEKLCNMGYDNVKEFGGILDWPYDIEK